MKSVTENELADVLGQEHRHANIEQVEEMIRTTWHIVMEAQVVRFMLVGLHHDGHV